jgi:hypothetical protein
MANIKWPKIIILVLSFGTLVSVAQSYVASSSNYILQSDSVNFGGGYSTSSSYKLQDTLGEIGSGFYSSSTMVLNGGYQAMPLDIYLAVSSPSNPQMSSVINGVGGGVSNGSSTWQVQTDNPAGYELSVRAGNTPAMTFGEFSFSDYVPSFSNPDYGWSTPDNESRFGFSPEGSDLLNIFLDNGLNCGGGILDTQDACWAGFSTTDQVIARSSLPNYPIGASTTIKFRAEVGSRKIQSKGSYQANVVVTAVAL